ncbi:MAG: class I SAM-dependent methyltransferase [Alphaproteobacteria bacterium]|nr:class I SAM-dependent methyltransferase [Alphaproteobacteria bacterium]
MNKNNQITLEFYKKQANEFVNSTQNLEFSELQNDFISKIKPNGKILDLGCGAGRDSKAFLSKGFDVIAVDASKEMCEVASKFTNLNVINETFQSYTHNDNDLDGIWACASLLHLSKNELPSIFEKYSKMLKINGIFYASFKYGDFNGITHERYYTYLTETSFNEIIKDIHSLKVLSLKTTFDVRSDRHNEKWLNIFMEKV